MGRDVSTAADRLTRGSDGAFRFFGERAESVLDRIGDGVYALDRDCRFTYVNGPFARMCRRSRAELIGRDIFDLFPQAVGTHCHAAHLRALRENTPVSYETLSAITGRWVAVTIHPDETGLSVCLRDVTDHRSAKQELAAAHDRMAEMLESISDAFYALDTEWRFTYVNRKAEEVWGRRRETLIGKVIWDEFPEALDSESYARHRQAARERRTQAFEAVSPILKRWLDISVYPSATGLSVYFRDITERKRQEEALRASRLFAERLVEICPAVLYVYDVRTDRTIYYNRDRKGTLGYTSEDMARMGGDRMRILMHPDDYARRPEHIARLSALPDGEPITVEYRMRRKDGDWAWLYGEWTVFQREESGAVAQILGSALDITERRRAEERQHLLMRELSHRVRNTLAVVQAMASQSLRRSPSMEAFAEAFSGRLRALSAAHGLLTRTDWQPIDLRAIAERVLDPHAGCERQIEISGPDVPLWPAQSLTLSLVLHELATNAVKYGALSAPSGGVRIRWTLEDGATPWLRLEWQELGGPPVMPPATEGFGLTTIRGAAAHELRGQALLSFAPDGLRCEICFPTFKGPGAGGPANPRTGAAEEMSEDG